MEDESFLNSGTQSTYLVRKQWQDVRALMLIIHAMHEVRREASPAPARQSSKEGRPYTGTVPRHYSCTVLGGGARTATHTLSSTHCAQVWQKALLTYDEEYMEQWDPFSAKRQCFYNPNSPGRQGWDMLMLPMMLVIAITVPFRIGFDIDVEIGTFGFWLDAIIDLYFLVDIVVNFRTAYFNSNGVIVTDAQKIATKYLKSWFTIGE
jgi:hypothetical protein